MIGSTVLTEMGKQVNQLPCPKPFNKNPDVTLYFFQCSRLIRQIECTGDHMSWNARNPAAWWILGMGDTRAVLVCCMPSQRSHGIQSGKGRLIRNLYLRTYWTLIAGPVNIPQSENQAYTTLGLSLWGARRGRLKVLFSNRRFGRVHSFSLRRSVCYLCFRNFIPKGAHFLPRIQHMP